jgi:hypothetical protein
MRNHYTQLAAPRSGYRAEAEEDAAGMDPWQSYFDTVRARLQETFTSAEDRGLTVQLLQIIVRNLVGKTYVCSKTAADLSSLRALSTVTVSRLLRILEGMGAITREKSGRMKVIRVNPDFDAPVAAG